MQLKECVNDFKNKLYVEVQNYERKRANYEDIKTKLGLFREIINIFNTDDIDKLHDNSIQLSFLLPLVYDEVEANSIYNKIIANNYSMNDKTILIIKEKINNDFLSLSNQLHLLQQQILVKKPTVIEFRKILSNYKYLGLITTVQIDLITKVMQQYKYEPKDQIRILESIRMHNIRVKYTDVNISYTVVNMLDDNYQKYEIEQLDNMKYKNRFQTLIESLSRSVKMDDSIDDVIELLPELESGNYTLDEFDYIYKTVINNLIEDLMDNINSISDKSIYDDIELRKVVILEYNENKRKYNKLQYSYNNKRLIYTTKMEREKELENSELKVVNNIFYQLTSNGEISFLERDIKDFPEEYLLKVKDLIEDKKHDSLAPGMDKSFNSIHKQMKEYRELRTDQVRIIYKHISQNNYLIVGAFVKKSDNDRMMYGNMASRNSYIDISTTELLDKELENSVAIEERLYSFIDEKSRKGSR